MFSSRKQTMPPPLTFFQILPSLYVQTYSYSSLDLLRKIHLSNVSIPGQRRRRNQYCVFGMDSCNLSNAAIKITVAILFKHKTLTQCCFSVADRDTPLNYQRDKSMCVLCTLNAIPFDKQIYIYLKLQKLSGDF